MLEYHRHTVPFWEGKNGAHIRQVIPLSIVSIPKILFYIGTRDLRVDGGDFTLRPKMGEKCHKRHLLKISYSFDIMHWHCEEFICTKIISDNIISLQNSSLEPQIRICYLPIYIY